MKKNLSIALSANVLLFVLTLLMGCAGVGLVAGGKFQTYTGSYSITLESARDDILDIIAEVGKTMDYSVSGLDSEHSTISLSSGTSVATTGLLGKSNQATIYVAVAELGKKLDIKIYLVGNFGAGTQKAADKLFEEFKAKLLEKTSPN